MKPFSLMVITNSHWNSLSYLQFLNSVVRGGVNCIQIRDKFWTPEKFHFAAKIIPQFQHQGITVLINDSVYLAKLFNTGVHLGQNDMHPLKARKILGNNAIIGLTIEDESELAIANQLVQTHPNLINYVACTVVLDSNTKKCKRRWGIAGLKFFSEHTPISTVAIGGVKISNAQEMLDAGAEGLAIVGELHNSKNPEQTAREFAQCFHR